MVTKNVITRKVRRAGNSAWQRFTSQRGESGAAGRVRTAATGLRVELSGAALLGSPCRERKPRAALGYGPGPLLRVVSAARLRRAPRAAQVGRSSAPCLPAAGRTGPARPAAGARAASENRLKHPLSSSPVSVTAGRTTPLTIRCDTAPFQFRLLYRRSRRLHLKAEQGKEKMRSSGMRAK